MFGRALTLTLSPLPPSPHRHFRISSGPSFMLAGEVRRLGGRRTEGLIRAVPWLVARESYSFLCIFHSHALTGYALVGCSTSLLKKYGVCDNKSIGKGATAVVRLAHKWDRREEKLYAVKVSRLIRNRGPDRTDRFAGHACRNSGNVVRTRRRGNISRSSLRSSVYLRPCTIPM